MDKRLTIGIWVLILGGGLMALLWLNPDLGLRIRSQVVEPMEGPSSISKQVQWTPGGEAIVGDTTLTFTADDGQGGITSEDVTLTVAGPDVGIEAVEVVPEARQATVRWATQSPGRRGRVDFDLTDAVGVSAGGAEETDTREHEVIVTELLPCTTYTMRVGNEVAAEAIAGNLRRFTTTGCTGGASVQGTGMGSIAAGAESTVSLAGKAAIRMPAGAVGEDGQAQIHQLDREAALATIGTPGDELSAVTGLYELSAYVNAREAVSTFNQPVTVELTYTPATDTDTSTLTLWRHDGSSWSELEDCTVDSDEQRVRCTTDSFSAVAGFASGSETDDEEPEPEPEPQPDNDGGGDSGGGDGGGDSGGGDGGDSGGDDGGEPSLPPAKGFVYQAETGWNVTGTYSGVQGKAVKIAAGSDLLSNTITAPSEDYYFYLKARHDRPGPVSAAVYVAPKGGRLRAWKTVRLDRNDDKFYAHRLGVLRARDFPGGTYKIGIRLLNDTYDRNDPANEATDRNLWVDWVILANRPNLSQVRVTDRSRAPSGGTGGGGGNGVTLLPQLNSYMRSEDIPVTVDNWKYYAWRLTRPGSHRAAIGSEAKLRTVMRYWRGVNPGRPRGEIIN